MFERFSEPARRVVVLAQEEARERGDAQIRTEHLLLGVCRVRDGSGAALLAVRGVDAAGVEADLRAERPPDSEALAALGIDLDEVRGRVEETFGPGALENTRAAGRRRTGQRWRHIPFDRDARKVLELSLREAIRRGDRSLSTEHILLGLLHTDTPALSDCSPRATSPSPTSAPPSTSRVPPACEPQRSIATRRRASTCSTTAASAGP